MEAKADKNHCLLLVEDGATTPALPVSLSSDWVPSTLPNGGQGFCPFRMLCVEAEGSLTSYLVNGVHFPALQVLEAGREGLTLVPWQARRGKGGYGGKE